MLLASYWKAGKPIRVIVRDASKFQARIRKHAVVFEGSPEDPVVLDRAFTGADAFFWVVPPESTKTLKEAYLEFTRPAVEAIRNHGLKRVLAVTTPGRGRVWQDKARLVTASLHVDNLLMSTSAAFRPPSFRNLRYNK